MPRGNSSKRKGETAELRFWWAATERGLIVSRPHGDSARYDFIVDNGRRLFRIQVKSTSCRSKQGYLFQTVRAHRLAYTRSDLDFFACYLVPFDIWYIVPIGVAEGITGVWVHPQSRWRRGRHFERFREAWALLLAPP